MVNLSSLPIIKIHGRRLYTLICECWKVVTQDLSDNRGGGKCSSNTDYTRRSQIFRHVSFSGYWNIPEKIINIIYELSQSEGFTDEDLQKCKELIKLDTARPRDLEGLKVPLKILLILLWSEGALTLPPSFNRRGVLQVMPRLYEFTDNFVVYIPASVEEKGRNTNSYRTLMYSSDWNVAEDISVDDIWRLVRADSLVDQGFDGKKAEMPNRFIRWVESFSKCRPDIVSEEVSRALRFYCQATGTNKLLKEEYQSLEDVIEIANLSVNQRRTLSSQKYYLKKNTRPKQDVICGDIDSLIAKFSELTKKNRPSSLEAALGEFYPPVEGFDFTEIAKNWKPYLEAFLKKERKRNGVSNFGAIKGYCNIFMDYLFFFLPRWFLIFPDAEVKYPLSPHFFEGVYFWNRDEDLDFGGMVLPPTLFKLFFTRRSQSTQCKFISTISNFFESSISIDRQLRSVKGDSALPCISNPVDLKGDSIGSGARKQSDKIPFPLRTIPFIRAYVRLIEHVGYALQQSCLYGNVKISEQIRTSDWLDLQSLGLQTVLSTRVNGKEIEVEINKIPNVYSWYFGSYKKSSGEESKTWMPWLSVTRMLSAELFTGQRMQNIQWLDLDAFDKYSGEEFFDLYLTLIFITIDKTNPRRVSLIQRDVMEMLLKEKDFQLNTCLTPPRAIFYEDEDERYGMFRPLFRSPSGLLDGAVEYKGKPFSDSKYVDVWQKILLGVQILFNSVAEEKHSFVYLSPVGKKILKERWVPTVKKLRDEDFSDSLEYCPLSLLSTHTPHAMRTNLVTWCRYAGMEFEEIAIQTGHRNPISTKIYSKPQIDYFISLVQQEKLLRVMSGDLDESVFDSRGIRPSQLNSAVREAFLNDRGKAISQFRMFSIDSLFVETPKSGLIYCSQNSIDQVAFLDHCLCPFSAMCPKFVLDAIQDYQRCGLCPVAVFCVDNLDAIQARIRGLAFEISSKTEQLAMLDGVEVSQEKLEELRFKLTLDKLEFVSLTLISRHLESQLTDLVADKSVFYVREPEIINKIFAQTVPASSQFSNFIATIKDMQDFPDMKPGNYMARINRIARSFSFSAPDEPLTIDIVVSKIKSILKMNNISLLEFIKRVDSRGLRWRLGNDKFKE